MLAHNNQENVVIAPPTGGKAFQTPAPGKMAMKTPFKIPLNDENGGSALHPKTGKKPSIFAGRDPSAFITPVGPRRQALTGKTTNLKARSLAPSGELGKTEKGSLKPQNTKLAIYQTAETAANDDVPEIEYMPPGPHDIPFTPEGFEESLDYSFLKNNYMRGAHRAFLAGIDEEGKSSLQRSMEANQRRLDAELDAETEALVAKISRMPPPRTRIPSSGPLAVSKTRRTEEKKPAVKRSTSRPASTTSRPTSRAGTASSRPASRTGTTATSRPSSRAGTAASRPASRAGTTTSRPTTSTSRPSSRSSAYPHTRTASTADSKKAAELLSQRPRSTSTRTTSNARPTRPTTATTAPIPAPIPAPKTIGYHAGREIKANVLDAIEQIQREDAEAEELGLPAIIIPEEEDDVVIDMPSPLILEEEEEFVFTLGV